MATHEKISFVILLTIDGQVSGHKSFRMHAYHRDDSCRRMALAFDASLKTLPMPETNAINTAIRASDSGYGIGMRGGMHMAPAKNRLQIKVPARTLLEVLAGRLSAKEAFDHSDMPEGNVFARALEKGMLIRSAALERLEEKDDDWVEITLEGPDAAISPFVSSP